MIATPPPVLRLPIGGTCDANGNLTLKSIVPSRSWYGVFTAILKVSSGAPQWEIDLLGMPVGLAGGGSAVMGAVYSNPEDSFTLIVSGAAPSAVVSGGLYGFLAAEPEQLPQLGAISSGGGGSSGALPGGQAVVKGTISAVNGSVAIAVGGSSTIGIALAANSTAIVGATSLQAQGTVDDTTWVNVPAFFFSYWQYNGLIPPVGAGWDANTDVIVACAGYSQIRIKLVSADGAQTYPILLTLRATPGAALSLPTNQQPSVRSQPVVLASDQAPIPISSSTAPSGTVKSVTFNVQLAANATLDLVAAVAGQTVYCLTLDIESNAAVIAEVNLQDDVPVKLASIRTDNLGWKGGKALLGAAGTIGHKVQLKNQSALTPTVAGELVYLQK